MMTPELSAPAPADTQPDTADSDRQAAEDMLREALDRGEALSGAELARRFGRPDRWGRRVAAAVRAERTPPAASTNGNGRPPDTSGADSPDTLTGGQPDRDRSPSPVTGPDTRRRPDRTPARVRTDRSRTADRSRAVTEDSGWRPGSSLTLRLLGAAAVIVVAVVAAVISYQHVADLARTVGLGDMAGWYPLALDGLAVASTCSLVADRQAGRPRDRLAVLGLALGVAGSLLGNLADVAPGSVDPQHVRLALAAAPPVALAIAGHLAFRTLGERK